MEESERSLEWTTQKRTQEEEEEEEKKMEEQEEGDLSNAFLPGREQNSLDDWNISLCTRARRTVQWINIDSSLWDRITPRSSDIIITTFGKAGTTWTQQIVMQLLGKGVDPALGEPDWNIHRKSIWVDSILPPPSEKLALLEGLPSPRVLKSHLPFDAVNFRPECKYIYVGRNGRDVALSAFNHYTAFTDNFYSLFPDMPRPPPTFAEFFDLWLKTGYPYEKFLGAHCLHVLSWWSVVHHPSVLFVHFDEMKANLGPEMARIAKFLGVDPDPSWFDSALQHSTFEYMKKNEARFTPPFDTVLEGRFIHQGESGRWKNTLNAEQNRTFLEYYTDRLPRDCFSWLERPDSHSSSSSQLRSSISNPPSLVGSVSDF